MEYKVEEILSSREFYRMVDILNGILRLDEICTLDLTGVNRIDAVVIPNLLLLGKYIEKKTQNIPYIRLGEDLRSGYLKKYLMNIKFYELSSSYFYYENEAEKYCGLIGKDMDKNNTTECFSLNEGFGVAQRRLYYNIYPFIKNYFKEFKSREIIPDDILNIKVFDNNIVAKFIKEMIDNSFENGKSDVIVTVQTNYKKEKIFLSVSDSGRGFLRAQELNMDEYGNFISRKSETDLGYNVLGRRPRDEKEAILIGMYKRKFSNTYGLFNVIRRILDLNGIIRIHSNNVQFILTERLKKIFSDGQLVNIVPQLMGYNVKKTSNFDGVHIEMELPLSIYKG